ncbi:ThuA domain-containing protein [Bacillus sp. USDA818B3_A]|uniref:ThuA domain-containing protein n=1 Tax=Bacillus sp. USDA818B3_A TaxID=2698834 RepID=UPI001369579D|nr:ThuA domain-containing protein [Bacillus sp. USDA818B3_A]
MVRITAVLGDYYHPAESIKESLENALQTIKDLQLKFCTYEQLEDELSTQPDAVILFKEDRLNPTEEKATHWMTEELALQINRYVSNGGGWLAWHSGLASYSPESAYTQMLKGYFLHHPEKHQMVQYTSVPGNEINTNPIAFEFMDEHYFVHCEEESTGVFLISDSIDGHAPAGWSHHFGEGRVCCLTPAHNKEGLLNPEFLCLLGNCVSWITA